MLIPKHDVDDLVYYENCDIENRAFKLIRKQSYLCYALKFFAMKHNFIDTNEEVIFEFIKHFYPTCSYTVDKVCVNYLDMFGNTQTTKGMIMILTIFDEHNNMTKTINVPENSWIIIKIYEKDILEISVMSDHDMFNEYDIVDQENYIDSEPVNGRSVTKICSPTEESQADIVYLTFETPSEYKVEENEIQCYNPNRKPNKVITNRKQSENEKSPISKTVMITVGENFLKQIKHYDLIKIKLPLYVLPMRIRNSINKGDKLIIGSETSTNSVQKIVKNIVNKNDGFVYVEFDEENHD